MYALLFARALVDLLNADEEAANELLAAARAADRKLQEELTRARRFSQFFADLERKSRAGGYTGANGPPPFEEDPRDPAFGTRGAEPFQSEEEFGQGEFADQSPSTSTEEQLLQNQFFKQLLKQEYEIHRTFEQSLGFQQLPKILAKHLNENNLAQLLPELYEEVENVYEAGGDGSLMKRVGSAEAKRRPYEQGIVHAMRQLRWDLGWKNFATWLAAEHAF